MAFKKEVKGDNNSANEIVAHNRVNFIIDTGGAGVILLIIFLLLLLIATLIFLWTTYHTLLIALVLALVIGAVLFAIVLGISCTVRHLSDTRKRHRINNAAVKWAEMLHCTDSHIAWIDPRIRIENNRIIEEVRHYNQGQPQIPGQVSENVALPPLADLMMKDVEGKE